jgi:predicted MPP superfamily phosphohydrolase
VLHVSRGLSGCQPLRILCRPELALLVLHNAAPA